MATHGIMCSLECSQSSEDPCRHLFLCVVLSKSSCCFFPGLWFLFSEIVTSWWIVKFLGSYLLEGKNSVERLKRIKAAKVLFSRGEGHSRNVAKGVALRELGWSLGEDWVVAGSFLSAILLSAFLFMSVYLPTLARSQCFFRIPLLAPWFRKHLQAKAGDLQKGLACFFLFSQGLQSLLSVVWCSKTVVSYIFFPIKQLLIVIILVQYQLLCHGWILLLTP